MKKGNSAHGPDQQAAAEIASGKSDKDKGPFNVLESNRSKCNVTLLEFGGGKSSQVLSGQSQRRIDLASSNARVILGGKCKNTANPLSGDCCRDLTFTA